MVSQRKISIKSNLRIKELKILASLLVFMENKKNLFIPTLASLTSNKTQFVAAITCRTHIRILMLQITECVCDLHL